MRVVSMCIGHTRKSVVSLHVKQSNELCCADVGGSLERVDKPHNARATRLSGPFREL